MPVFERAQGGQPLKISAATWNAMQDATRAHLQGQFNSGGKATAGVQQSTVVLVKNASGADVRQYAPLAVDTPLIASNQNLAEFLREPMFRGDTPVVARHPALTNYGRFVVTLEPIAANAIGRAVISGVTVARVKRTTTGNTHADIEHAQTGWLVGSSRGGAEVISWGNTTDDGTSLWCLIRIGSRHIAPGPSYSRFYSAADSWTIPQGVTRIITHVIGGGGGGGGGGASRAYAVGSNSLTFQGGGGGGGGGGGYVRFLWDVLPGDTVEIAAVGAAGMGGAAGSAGTTGGNTTVTITADVTRTVTANGGSGGSFKANEAGGAGGGGGAWNGITQVVTDVRAIGMPGGAGSPGSSGGPGQSGSGGAGGVCIFPSHYSSTLSDRSLGHGGSGGNATAAGADGRPGGVIIDVYE